MSYFISVGSLMLVSSCITHVIVAINRHSLSRLLIRLLLSYYRETANAKLVRPEDVPVVENLKLQLYLRLQKALTLETPFQTS